MKTKIQVGFHGWRASTQVSLGSGRVLNISTGKCTAGSVRTTALVSHMEGMFDVSSSNDFLMILSQTRYSLCSKKAVRTQHETALKNLKSVKAQALAHYTMS
ncbi:hypothetical protein [Polaromonas naphthalenivorans]|uniref:hypothetical protein n=1 Tax=Polaromonas naphthalenivorans TaxID=216465 RepID=UPI0012EEA124|nr:hypothetical protein [Polaromonas naphthalenivorans]